MILWHISKALREAAAVLRGREVATPEGLVTSRLTYENAAAVGADQDADVGSPRSPSVPASGGLGRRLSQRLSSPSTAGRPLPVVLVRDKALRNRGPRNRRPEQEELWQRAAEYSRLLDMMIVHSQRQLVANLRDSWIALGNDSPFLDKAGLTKQVAELEKIHIQVHRF